MRDPRTWSGFGLVSLILLASVLACGPSAQTLDPATPPTAQPEPSLVGTWVNPSGGYNLAFVFGAGGDFSMYRDGNELSHGQDTVLESIAPPGIDLIHADGDSVYTISEFSAADELQLENNLPGADRRASFSDPRTFLRTTP